MADTSIGTPEQLRDPNYTPPLHKAIPLGIQHVLAMFVSNVTPAIIVAGAAGFGFGSNSPDFPELALSDPDVDGVCRHCDPAADHHARSGRLCAADCSGHILCLSADHDPAGCGQGRRRTGRAFRPASSSAASSTPCWALFIGKIRFALPPLVTGLVVTMIGLALVKVGIQYAAGGVPAIGTAGIRLLAELVGCAGGDRRHLGPQVLHQGHAVRSLPCCSD